MELGGHHLFIHSFIHPSSLPSYFHSSFFPPSYLPSYLPTKIYQVPINVKHKVVNKAVNASEVLSKVVNTAKSLVALCSYISQDSIRRRELHSDFNRESLIWKFIKYNKVLLATKGIQIWEQPPPQGLRQHSQGRNKSGRGTPSPLSRIGIQPVVVHWIAEKFSFRPCADVAGWEADLHGAREGCLWEVPYYGIH